MNKLKIGVVVILVAASLAASLVIQRHAQRRGRQQKESSEQQAEQLTQLAAENERLSYLIAQMKSAEPLSREQLSELLRLRNEAGQLRNGPVKAQLQTTNAQLRAMEAKRERQLAEAQATTNYWSKDQLAYSGYADPESAMKSMLAAATSRNPVFWRQSATPEAMSHLQEQWKKRGLSEAQQDEEIKTMTDMLFSSSSGFHIIDQQMTSADETVVNLSFDGEGTERKFVLKKVGNEWKFHKLLLAGKPEPQPQ